MFFNRSGNMGVTIYDVAKEAKVSPCWVSLVLRDHPRAKELRPETKQRIRDAAAKLDYRKNILATNIRTGNNENTVALVAQGKDTSLFYSIIANVARRGYGIRIYNTESVEETQADMKANQLNKAIVLSTNEQAEEFCKESLKKNIRTVLLGGGGIPGIPSFRTDNFNAMSHAVRYLYELGHRKIGLYCGPHKHISSRERHEGFLAGLRDCGLEDCLENVICEEFKSELFFDLLRKKHITAICAIYTGLSIKLEFALLKNGLRVPEDVSILNFGNRLGMATDYSYIPLDSIMESTNEIVEKAIDHLLLSEEKVPCDEICEYLFPTTIIPAASTCPPNNKLVLPEKLES